MQIVVGGENHHARHLKRFRLTWSNLESWFHIMHNTLNRAELHGQRPRRTQSLRGRKEWKSGLMFAKAFIHAPVFSALMFYGHAKPEWRSLRMQNVGLFIGDEIKLMNKRTAYVQ